MAKLISFISVRKTEALELLQCVEQFSSLERLFITADSSELLVSLMDYNSPKVSISDSTLLATL